MRLRSAGLVAALIGIAVLVPLAGSAAGSPTAPAVALDTSCEDGHAARPDVPCTHGPDSVRAFGGMARLTDEPAAPGPAALTGLCWTAASPASASRSSTAFRRTGPTGTPTS